MNGTKVLKLGDRLVFWTSGTTGQAKCVNRCNAEILREVEYWSQRYKARRVLRVAKPEHIYGYIWSVLLSAAWHVEAVGVRGWNAEEFAGFVRPGDLIVGYAGAWERWRDVDWPEGVTAVHSGDPAPDGVAEALLENGLAKWVDVYGCTELGAVGVREDLVTEYELVPWWPEQLEGVEAVDELEWMDGRRFRLGRRKAIPTLIPQ